MKMSFLLPLAASILLIASPVQAQRYSPVTSAPAGGGINAIGNGFTCSGLSCTCSGEADCIDMFGGGLCKDDPKAGVCDDSGKEPVCICLR